MFQSLWLKLAKNQFCSTLLNITQYLDFQNLLFAVVTRYKLLKIILKNYLKKNPGIFVLLTLEKIAILEKD